MSSAPRNHRTTRRIDRQLVVVCVGATLVATAVALSVAVWGYGRLSDTATAAQDVAARNEIVDQTNATLALVRAQADAVQAKVDSDLRVARHVLDEQGALTVDGEPEQWEAVNQYTKEVTLIDLPAMTIGDDRLPKNGTMALRTPIIDDIHDLVGGTTTIFQRMNDDGDMLRVATNVETLDGTRAIGTYIPATNPDGAPNPVVSTVLQGETFRGIAYVVNAWYVTAYEPIFDESGAVVGILYVGVRQENIASMRAAIESTTVLDTGVVAVVGGTGDDAGVPIISAQFAEGQPLADAVVDGDDTWLTGLLDDAVAAPGEVVPERRTILEGLGPVVVQAAYFQPWDWVVLTITPESDLTALSDELADTSGTVLQTLLVVAGLAAAVVGLVAWLISRSIAGVFRTHAGTAEAGVANMARAAGVVADNVESTAAASRAMQATSTEVAETTATVASATEQLNASFSVAADGASQIGTISREAVQAIETANTTIERLATSSTEIDRFTEIINGIAEQTKLLALNATIEAARAGEAGRGFAVVASEVKDLAAATGRATEEIASQIAQIQADAASARQDVERVATVTGELNAVQQTLVSSVGEQQLTSTEIAASITRAAAGVRDLARQADAVAEVSQRSGEAVRLAGSCIGSLETAVEALRSTVGTSGRTEAVDCAPAMAALPAAPVDE